MCVSHTLFVEYKCEYVYKSIFFFTDSFFFGEISGREINIRLRCIFKKKGKRVRSIRRDGEK